MELSNNTTGLILILLGIAVLVWFFYADKGRDGYVKSCIESMKRSFDTAAKYESVPKYTFYALGIFALLRPGKAGMVAATSTALITSGVAVINQWSWAEWLTEKADQVIESETPPADTRED